ncbi:DUF4197 domain-containing protein [Undibacterium arcticum]
MSKNGFLNNDKVKIQLPGILEQARPLLKMTGRGQHLDDLVVSMNRAAEAAVPMAKPLLLKAVKSMSVTDAKKYPDWRRHLGHPIFFVKKTSDQLSVTFLPVVKKVTDRSGLSAQYNGVMGQISKLGLGQQQATVESYVTQRTLDGLYTMIGEEEKKRFARIRSAVVARSSARFSGRCVESIASLNFLTEKNTRWNNDAVLRR